MSENQEGRQAERLERVVRDLLAGRRLKIGAGDDVDADAIMAAARLAGTREAYPRMAPGFRRLLQRRLAAEAGRRRLLSRREALVAGTAALAGAAGAGVIGRTAGLFGPASRPAPARAATVFDATEIAPTNGTWFDAGPLTALPDRQAVHFRAGAVSTMLFREGDQVRALSAICTHLPCELAWNSTARTLDCPCHNRSFDIQGRSAAAEYDVALPSLPTVQVKVVDGNVRVLGA
jgi:cytochrome b6-f complex iron-sulfur subunit